MAVFRAPLPPLLIQVLVCFFLSRTQGYTSNKPPFLTHQDLCGVWKLSQSNSDKEVVLRLNDDGTFDPYSQIPTKETETLCRGGCWEYRDQTLLLAADRPPQPTPEAKDTLLVGKLEVQVSESLTESEEPLLTEDDAATAPPEVELDVHLTIPHGEISTGKFMYPKKHKEFFEEPILFQRNSIGTFHMNQLLGNLNARLKSEREAEQHKPQAKFHKNDFYNRTFYLTATPHPVNPAYAAQDLYYDKDKAMMDIRILPITFCPNNTFAAIGTEKILRGRYGMCGEERDRLWFQVSLFGAGRSAPGSVYSEGRLLSKDDQRGYVGPIQAYPNQRNETIFFVDGLFYYGEDLKNPRKTRSWGSFTLQETDDNDADDDEEKEEEEDAVDGNSKIAKWEDEEEAFQ